MSTQNFGTDLSKGSIPGTMLRFALPILLSTLLSAGYSVINTLWVAHLLGGPALAASAIAFPVTLLMVAIASAFTLANTIVIARLYGAKKTADIQSVVNTSWSLALIFVVFFLLFALAGIPYFIQLIGTSAALMNTATNYVRLMALGFAFMYPIHVMLSTLRAVGDTKTPLYFTIAATLLNTALDPVLITGFGFIPRFGLNGAALASLIVNGLACIGLYAYMGRKHVNAPLVPRAFSLSKPMVQRLLGIGLPSFVQQLVMSVAIAIMTSLVNRYGPQATAAFGIASRIDTFVVVPALAMMMAVSTITSQNLGALKPERISSVYRWGLFLNTPLIVAVCLTSIVFPHWIMSCFVNDPTIIHLGSAYLQIVGAAYILLIPLYINNGVLNGAGRTLITMLISVCTICLARLPLAIGLSATALHIDGLWVATAASFALNAGIGYWYYRSKRWLPSNLATLAI